MLLDPEGRLGLGELDVGLPQLLIAPIADVRAQEIGALREGGPVVERGIVNDAKADTSGAAIRLQRDREAGSGALVLLQDAADLAVHHRRIDTLLWTRHARSQPFERLFDPPADFVV